MEPLSRKRYDKLLAFHKVTSFLVRKDNNAQFLKKKGTTMHQECKELLRSIQTLTGNTPSNYQERPESIIVQDDDKSSKASMSK
jgi:hypothetical protein